MKKTSRLLTVLIILVILVFSAFFVELNYEKFFDSEDAYLTQGCVIYPQLSKKQQQIYRRVYRYSSNFKTTIPLFNCDEQDILVAVQAVKYDHPEFFWFVENSYRYGKYLVEFELDSSEKENLQQQYQQCLDAADQIIAQLSYQSSFEAILQIHDYLIENTEYVSDVQYNQDIRSVLLNQQSVCAGYARTFELLCHRLGYECGYAVGYSVLNDEQIGHSWNYVRINGEYYWVDVTWDDLDNENETDDRNCYDFFLISDEILMINHQLTEQDFFTYPVCDDYGYSDFTGNEKPFTEFEKETFEQLVCETIQSGEEFFAQYTNKEDYEAALEDLQGEGELNGLKELVRKFYPTEAFEIAYSFNDNENRIWFKLTVK